MHMGKNYVNLLRKLSCICLIGVLEILQFVAGLKNHLQAHNYREEMEKDIRMVICQDGAITIYSIMLQMFISVSGLRFKPRVHLNGL